MERPVSSVGWSVMLIAPRFAGSIPTWANVSCALLKMKKNKIKKQEIKSSNCTPS